MDEEIQKPEPKISDVEIILIGTFYAVLDVVDFIPTAGDLTDVIAAPMGFYYWMKGLNGVPFLVAEGVEAFPALQEFPFMRTITWGLTVWFDRNPKLARAIAVVEEAAEVLEGNAEEVKGAAAETARREPGAYGHEPGDERTELPEDKNARPSETTTESDSETVKRKAREKSGESEVEAGQDEAGGGEEEQKPETEEERRKRLAGEDVDEMMRAEAEIPPIEQAEKEDFSEKGPRSQENEATKRLSARFAKKQRENEEQRKREKEEEERIQLEKLKQAQVITQEQEADDSSRVI